MNYTQIDPTYKYDVIADAIYGREMEYFHYDFDLKNFQEIILTLPEGDHKSQIQGRIDSTLVQMSNVMDIYNALVAQIDDQVAYDAAVVRAIAKRAAA